MRKIIYKGIIVIVSILLTSVVIIESLIIVEGNKIEKKEVDYLIVLGARLYGEIPSTSLLEWLKVAHQYLAVIKSLLCDK